MSGNLLPTESATAHRPPNQQRRVRGAVLRHSPAASPYVDSLPLSIEDLSLDQPGDSEVLVRMEAAGLCHSDLSVINGDRQRPLPMLLGHEAAGIVEQMGSGVSGLSVGDRVTMTFLPRCEQCRACATGGRLPCERGTDSNTRGTLLGGDRRIHSGAQEIHHHLGVSGFATHAVVDQRSVVKVGNDVPADVAAILGCAVLTGAGALLNTAPPTAEDSVAVIGLGGVGMAALLTGRALGCRRVIGVDQNPDKLELARNFGADAALTPEEAQQQNLRADVVVEAAGHPRAFETAYAITATGGTLVTVGLPAPDATSTIKPLDITARALTIRGSYLGSAIPQRDIPRLAQMWREGSLPLEKLISSHIQLDEINIGMDRLARGETLRQIISFP